MPVGEAVAPGRKFSFGTFSLDCGSLSLKKNGLPVELRPKSFDVLRHLVSNAGRIVSKEELFAAAWPDVVVTDDSLVQCIHEVRQALGDDGQTFVKTVPRRGYMFVAEVTPEAAMPLTSPAAAAPTPGTVVERFHSAIAQALPAKKVLMGAAGAAVILFGVAIALLSRPPPPIKTIAVLPFQHFATDRSLPNYLGIGIADLITLRLAKLQNVTVRPTSSVLKYSDKESLEAGRSLGVDAVIEGRAYEDKGRIRVAVQMINVADGRSLWSGQFDQGISEDLNIQDAVAARVAGMLTPKLMADRQARRGSLDTTSAAALEAYAKGRYQLSRRTGASIEASITNFESAIASDPDFAMAYCGLADALNLIGAYGGRESRSAFARAQVAAQKAMAIDSEMAEPYAALAFAQAHADHNWPAAFANYQKALSISPSYSTAWQWLALAEVANGHFDHAIRASKSGLEVDPASLIIGTDVGRHYYYAGRYAEAVEQLLKVLQLDPGFIRAHRELGRAYLRSGQHEAAIRSLEKAVELSGREDSALASLAGGYAQVSRQADARAILNELLERKKERYVSPYNTAVIYAALKEPVPALAHLQQAYEDRFNWLVFAGVEPDFSELHGHGAFEDLLRKMHLDTPGTKIADHGGTRR